MVTQRLKKDQKELAREIKNFEDIARGIIPTVGEVPIMKNIGIFGGVLPANRKMGGDHIIYVDFKTRYDLDKRIEIARKNEYLSVEQNLIMNKSRAGVLIADASGHSTTDAFLTGRLHDAFLTGMLYELYFHGQVTPQLFEILNTRLYKSSSIDRFVTMVYGEISENGKFRFISAGAPHPKIFSYKYNRFSEISQDRFTFFPPLGMYPSESDLDIKRNYSLLGYKKKYSVSEINLLGQGDILLLYTDGLEDHERGEEYFFTSELEKSLERCKDKDAMTIWNQVRDDIFSFNPEQVDDISFIIIKNEVGKGS